ncbi:Hypothetical protein ORPV_598 [Orpheovirus IHUMI-LCC2]|uniref:F-box domain-containing protein n=1 Tax=Orpheovirus IHUMI-LCC2 TaxID=2023057 RepID=A0A2I2L4M8_9VIRU|nr:Hypothetical protein ORPV_598 [Orpheovirus IHUMI-LCC2]SNW62502.1 Hypothetical protein ORPV_598 [Orpheovirus IHUMI-LCC2]
MEGLPEEIKCMIVKYLDVSALWNTMIVGGSLYESIKPNVDMINTENKIVNSKLIISYPNVKDVIGYVGINSIDDAYLISRHTSLRSAYFILKQEYINVIMEKYFHNVFMDGDGRLKYVSDEKRNNILYEKKFLFSIDNQYLYIHKDILIHYIYTDNCNLQYDVTEKLLKMNLYKYVYVAVPDRYYGFYLPKHDNICIIANGGGICNNYFDYVEILLNNEIKNYNFVLDYRYKNIKIDMSERQGCGDLHKIDGISGPFVNMISYYKEWKNNNIKELGFYCDKEDIQKNIEEIKEHIFSNNKEVVITLYTNGDTVVEPNDRIIIKSENEYTFDFDPDYVFQYWN